MYVIVYMQNVYGPFDTEGLALSYAKYNWQLGWIIRPIINPIAIAA